MAEQIGVSELVGMAMAGGSLKDTGFKHTVVGAVGMAGASGKSSYVLGCELHRLRCASQAERWGYAMGLFTKQVKVLAKRGRWRRVDDAMLVRLCDYALREWLFDVCIPCQGRGRMAIELYNPGEDRIEQTCDLCGGTGKGVPSIKMRIEALRIPVEEYMKAWGDRFEEIRGVLDKAYGVAQRSIARRLGRKVEDA
jgi:hypothetical protein